MPMDRSKAKTRHGSRPGELRAADKRGEPHFELGRYVQSET